MAKWVCTNNGFVCGRTHQLVELTDAEVKAQRFACSACGKPLERVEPADYGKYARPLPIDPEHDSIREPPKPMDIQSPILLQIKLAGDEQPTLRDLFAMMATVSGSVGSFTLTAQRAYELADAMMAVRAKNRRLVFDPHRSVSDPPYQVESNGKIVRVPRCGALVNGKPATVGMIIGAGDSIDWPDDVKGTVGGNLEVEVEFT